MKPIYTPKPDLKYNGISDADSYKFSHVYSEGCTRMMSYMEARGGDLDECTLFGAQYLMHKYLSKPITLEAVQEVKAFAAEHGEPFDEAMWLHVVNQCGGKAPIRIRAIPEGMVVPVRTAVLTIECWDPKCFGIVSWFETKLSRLWYPSEIAIYSRDSAKILKHYLEKTSDAPAQELPFKLHDFGARGVSCLEQSRIGGAAHLLSFMGSDTVEGIRMANHYYDIHMAGYSIPATEHSMMSMDGPDGEVATAARFVQKMLVDRQLPPGVPKLAACVSDTYNIYNMVRAWCGPSLLPLVQKSGGTLVIRPDSGDPLEVLPKIFNILEENLPSGSVVKNNKGYKVLPNYFRVIQGDGIDRKSMAAILEHITNLGWSASNLGFGSGGGLLQKVNRDSQKWAFKCCAALVLGRWVDVRKNPITDPGKQSKAGRLDTIRTQDGKIVTVAMDGDMECLPNTVMNTIFYFGDITFHTTFEECRVRMAL